MATRTGLVLILSVTFLLRLGFALTRTDLDTLADETHWDGIARSLWQQGLSSPEAGTYRPPLYPLLVASIYTLVDYSPFAVRFVQACLGVLSGWFIFSIGRQLGGNRTGLVGAAIAAIYPLSIFFAGVLMAETLLVTLCLLTFWCQLAFAQSPGRLQALGLGMITGLAGLCKPVALPWTGFFALVWLWQRSPSLRWGLMRLGFVAVGIGLVLAPWAGRNYSLTGRWVPIADNLAINLVIGNEPEATGHYRDGADYQALFDSLVGPPPGQSWRALQQVGRWALAEPLNLAKLGAKKLLGFWLPISPGATLWQNLIFLLSCGAVLLLGLWGTIRLRTHPAAWAVATLALSLTLVHLMFFAHIRFRLPLDAALMVPAAWLVCHLRGWLPSSSTETAPKC